MGARSRVRRSAVSFPLQWCAGSRLCSAASGKSRKRERGNTRHLHMHTHAATALFNLFWNSCFLSAPPPLPSLPHFLCKFIPECRVPHSRPGGGGSWRVPAEGRHPPGGRPYNHWAHPGVILVQTRRWRQELAWGVLAYNGQVPGW